MNRSAPLIWSRLFLPHPLPASQVATLLTRIASDRSGHPVVLETRADATGIQHLLACDAEFVHNMRRLLTDLIPGTIMTGLDTYTRPTMLAAGHLINKPAALPIASADPVPILRTLYSALSRKHGVDEAVCVQLVIGSGNGPSIVPSKIPAPGTTTWQLLSSGQPTASTETRNRIRDRAAHHTLDSILRIGVRASTADKRQRLARELHSAFSGAETPGVRLVLVREDPNRINVAPLTRRGVRQHSVPELIALTGWTVGHDQLPGMPPAHPKMLRADRSVHTTSRTFARSAVPGDGRELGLTSADMSFHGYALGPTGVGKSHLLQLIAEHAIKRGDAVFIVDPKAVMHEYLLERIPEKRWKDVVVLDATEEFPLSFNPLDATGRDPDAVADSVLAVFAAVFADGYGPRTADIFSASIRTLTRTGTTQSPHTLVDLPRLWTDSTFRRRLTAQVQGDVGLAGFWAWYESLKPAAQSNVIASPMNKLRAVIARPAAVRILGKSGDVRLRDLFRDRKIVFLPLNEGTLGPIASDLIGSLAIAEVWQAVQERFAETGRSHRPGLVIVDEADRFMALPGVSLADALARSRSAAVSWWLATQYWDQLPAAMKAAVKTNCRSKAVFRLESDDDARTIARLAPELEPDDFMMLGKYQIYLRLVANGITTPWALADVLPGTPAISDVNEVLQVSREHHRPADVRNAPDLPNEQDPQDQSQVLPVADVGQIGRRRRTK